MNNSKIIFKGRAYWRVPKLGEGRDKKGQVTLFVIISVVIVGAIILLFFFTRKVQGPTTTYGTKENPLQFIAECVEDSAIDAIDLMMLQGGYIEPKLYKEKEGQKIAYLCYTRDYNKACLNQEPLYNRHLTKEILSYIEPEIERCFSELEQEYERKGISTDIGDEISTTLAILPGSIEINIKRDFSFVDKESSKTYSEFKSFFISNLHSMADTIETIVSQEAQFCSFDQNSYMTFYPDTMIRVSSASEGTIFYNIKDKITGLESNIAIKGCVHRI